MARWQNIRTLDEMPSWVCPAHAQVIRRAAREIHARCDARTYIDTLRKTLCFGYDSPLGPRVVFDIPMYRDRRTLTPMTFDPVRDAAGVDDVIRTVRLARVPAATKEKWAAEQRAESERLKAQEAAEVSYETAREAIKQTEYQYDKHTMGKHYRKSVVMS